MKTLSQNDANKQMESTLECEHSEPGSFCGFNVTQLSPDSAVFVAGLQSLMNSHVVILLLL